MYVLVIEMRTGEHGANEESDGPGWVTNSVEADEDKVHGVVEAGAGFREAGEVAYTAVAAAGNKA